MIGCSLSVAMTTERELQTADYIRRDHGLIPSPQPGYHHPSGLATFTQGVTGHHVLSVLSFNKDQVLSLCGGYVRDLLPLPPPPPQPGYHHPSGLATFTQGVTGHHVLSVLSFNKDQVMSLCGGCVRDPLPPSPPPPPQLGYHHPSGLATFTQGHHVLSVLRFN